MRVDVYAPGRVVFDLSRATKAVHNHLRAPKIAPGCVKARLVNGEWNAGDYFGPPTRFARRLRFDLSAMPDPPLAPYDGCEIAGLYGHSWWDAWGTRDAVEIWLTVRGRRFFNDRAAGRDLAYFVRSRRVQRIRLSPTPQLGLRWFLRRYPGRVVALAQSSDHVPRHVIGVWVGPKTIRFVTTSSTGRRLFVVAVRGTLELPAKNLGDLAFVF